MVNTPHLKQIVQFALLILVDASLLISCAKKDSSIPVLAMSKPAIASTLAGSGAFSSNDGTGTSASFANPTALTVDASGNVYVVDNGKLIRKITPLGVVTTITTNSNDPVFLSNQSYGIAIDASGNLYTTRGSKIFKIAPGGLVSTFAGNGQQGFANGPDTTAMFNIPGGLVFDKAGNLYVSSQNNYNFSMIRKITPEGMVSTFAGTNLAVPAGTSSFDEILGMAIDQNGNIYVTDHALFRVSKVSPDGSIAILKTFQFPQTPVGIAVDASENVYVVDEISFEVDKITVNGIASAFAGRNAAGTDFVPFFYPWAIAIDPTGKILYVSDAGNNIIRKIEINDH